VLICPILLLLNLSAQNSVTGNFEAILIQAYQAAQKNDQKVAIKLAADAIRLEPKNPKGYYFRGRLFYDSARFKEAIKDFDQLLKLDPRNGEIYQRRGECHFRLGGVRESIVDFDRFIELVPQREPHHWQRGISYYLAGEFTKGRKQFELHQEVNSSDVENAVWHFCCFARDVRDLKKAQAELIDIPGDSRVPLMEVQALFEGKSTPEKVLKAAATGFPSEDQLKQRKFYAHLYLGMWHEVRDETDKALKHLKLASTTFGFEHYMGAVAKVYYGILKKGPIREVVEDIP
jgi:lipoprotein NlpI